MAIGWLIEPEVELGAGFAIKGDFSVAKASLTVGADANLFVDVGMQKSFGTREWDFPHELKPTFNPVATVEIDLNDDLHLEMQSELCPCCPL